MKELKPEDILTHDEAAALLKISPRTLREMKDGPDFVTTKKKARLYPRDWVMDWFNERRGNVRSTHDAEADENTGNAKLISHPRFAAHIPHRFVPRVGRSGEIHKANETFGSNSRRKGADA